MTAFNSVKHVLQKLYISSFAAKHVCALLAFLPNTTLRFNFNTWMMSAVGIGNRTSKLCAAIPKPHPLIAQ